MIRGLASAALALSLISPAAYAQQPALELALLLDVSESVDVHEFNLQIQGIVSALEKPEIQNAIVNQRLGDGIGVAISVIAWSGAVQQFTLVPWHYVNDYSSLLGLIEAVEVLKRPKQDVAVSQTAIGAALIYAIESMENNAYQGVRRTIDIASDGINNAGITVDASKAMAEEKGITINALAVLPETDPLSLARYYRQGVVTSDGFVMEAKTYAKFIQAMESKLLLEIAMVQ